MSRNAIAIACIITFIVGMLIVGVVHKFLIANVGVWIVLPSLAVCFFIGYLIERHEKQKRSDSHNQVGPHWPEV